MVNNSLNNTMAVPSMIDVNQVNQNVTSQNPQMVNPFIKDSGAPVNVNPKAAQTINGIFGTQIPNSFDRTMTPYNNVNGVNNNVMY